MTASTLGYAKDIPRRFAVAWNSYWNARFWGLGGCFEYFFQKARKAAIEMPCRSISDLPKARSAFSRARRWGVQQNTFGLPALRAMKRLPHHMHRRCPFTRATLNASIS